MLIYKQDPSDKAVGGVQGKSTSIDCEAEDDGEIIDSPPQKTYVKLPKDFCKYSNPIRLYHNTQFPLSAEKLISAEIADYAKQPDFFPLLQRYLQGELNDRNDGNVDVNEIQHINVYNSATAVIYSPSDPSGVGGMRQEFVRAVPTWRGGKSRYDCVFVDTAYDPVAIARTRLFFKLSYRGTSHSCALVHWFTKLEDEPSKLNGMWVVEHMRNPDGTPVASIVGINTLVRSAHLLPLFDDDKFVSKDLEHDDTLDHFNMFYVNRYIDHHSFLIASQIPP
jgi:hypothetical protein